MFIPHATPSASLIFWMVHEMSALTVSTDSTVSLAGATLLFSNICNPTVSRLPPPPPSPPLPPSLDVPLFEWPSGRIAKPEGKRETYEESPPLITMFKNCTLIGEYTIIEPELSVHESWRYSTLLSLLLAAWTKRMLKHKVMIIFYLFTIEIDIESNFQSVRNVTKSFMYLHLTDACLENSLQMVNWSNEKAIFSYFSSRI